MTKQPLFRICFCFLVTSCALTTSVLPAAQKDSRSGSSEKRTTAERFEKLREKISEKFDQMPEIRDELLQQKTPVQLASYLFASGLFNHVPGLREIWDEVLALLVSDDARRLHFATLQEELRRFRELRCDVNAQECPYANHLLELLGGAVDGLENALDTFDDLMQSLRGMVDPEELKLALDKLEKVLDRIDTAVDSLIDIAQGLSELPRVGEMIKPLLASLMLVKHIIPVARHLILSAREMLSTETAHVVANTIQLALSGVQFAVGKTVYITIVVFDTVALPVIEGTISTMEYMPELFADISTGVETVVAEMQANCSVQ